MDGDTQSMATAKPSRTRKQPSTKTPTPAQKQRQRDQIAREKTKQLEHQMYERTVRRTRLALARQKGQADALRDAGVTGAKQQPVQSSGSQPESRQTASHPSGDVTTVMPN